MARIEQNQKPVTKAQHSVLRGIAKTVRVLLTLPFKITLRILFLLLALFMLIGVCRTGILTVPLISSLVFREPHPIRQVDMGVMSDQLLLLRLQELVLDSPKQHPTTTLSESDMTALLEKYRLSYPGPFTSVQLAITPQHMEFFGTLSSNNRVKITAWIIPSVSGGKPVAQLTRVWIGDVAVPQWMVSQSVTEFFTTTGFNAMMPKLPLYAISLQDRAMIITL